jgi:hypothetical protein
LILDDKKKRDDSNARRLEKPLLVELKVLFHLPLNPIDDDDETLVLEPLRRHPGRVGKKR